VHRISLPLTENFFRQVSLQAQTAQIVFSTMIINSFQDVIPAKAGIQKLEKKMNSPVKPENDGYYLHLKKT
jgi:hypothetical protein